MPSKINANEVQWDKTPEINAAEVQWDNQPKPDSIGKQIYQNQKRSWGLFGRNVIEGVTALPNMIGDIVGLKSSEATSNLLTNIGFPKEETSAERIAGGMTRGMAGIAIPYGAGIVMEGSALPVVQATGQALTSAPGSQMLSGATGGGAAATTKEAGGGTTAQTIAGLAGGFAPSLIPYGVKVIPKKILGSPKPENVKAFSNTGAPITVGQATESRTARAFESLLTKTPGSAGVIAKKAEEEAAAIGNRIDNITKVLAPRTGDMEAGRQIEKGIIGEGGFISKFRAKQQQIYDANDKFILQTTEVPVNNTQAILNTLSEPIVNAEGFTKPLVNPFFTELRDGLISDLKQREPQMTEQLMTQASSQTLPYAALKQMRTKVGDLLASNDIRTDVPRAQLNRVYGAITKDMENAATLSSNPKAATAIFERANAYSSAGYKRIDNILQSVVNRGNPEDIFQAAISGTKEGTTTFRAVMQSIPQDARNALTATIVKKMGTALPNQQNNIGNVFSTNTFLTNWNNLSSEAKMTIFGRQGKEFKTNMDAIAKVASNIRAGSKVFANPSGTAPTGTLIGEAGTVAGGIYLILTGHPAAGATVVGGVAATTALANQSAKLMTNPKFISWLAQQTKKPIEMLPVAVNQLVQSAKTTEDKDMAIQIYNLTNQSNLTPDFSKQNIKPIDEGQK